MHEMAGIGEHETVQFIVTIAVAASTTRVTLKI
jgi:hypothetical protein